MKYMQLKFAILYCKMKTIVHRTETDKNANNQVGEQICQQTNDLTSLLLFIITVYNDLTSLLLFIITGQTDRQTNCYMSEEQQAMLLYDKKQANKASEEGTQSMPEKRTNRRTKEQTKLLTLRTNG